jgi:non-specific serine/threonine protein kinase
MNLVQIETNVELIERVSDRDLARQRSGARGLGDAGEALDTQARTAHRQRIAELREELTEARNFNDRGRIEKLEAEIEFFTQELAGAVGLGGRNRKAASATERARVNVTRAIKTVVKKIAEQNPALELYFSTTIKTGAFCSYTPDPRFPLTWQF